MKIAKSSVSVVVPTTMLLLSGCGTSNPAIVGEATYATYREKPALVLYDYTIEQSDVDAVVEEIIEEEEEEYDEYDGLYVVEPEEVVWDQEYEDWDEVYPDPQGYAQENYENEEYVSYVEWTGAVASAYSVECNGGSSTASGIPLDDYTPTVASRWLPLGSYVEVVYGDASVVCQVTDRGPYVYDRDLDLSLGAVNALGVYSTDEWGVREVCYRML